MTENEYVLRMIERGLFPVPLVILVFETTCDNYSRAIECDVAFQLRSQGHSAFGDDTRMAWTIYPWFYILVEEQAYQFSVLRQIWAG